MKQLKSYCFCKLKGFDLASEHAEEEAKGVSSGGGDSISIIISVFKATIT